jgi:3-hydroxyisobutyrate dehydrogenase-like beta-hydroxyacid dehydrogenase
VIGAGAGLQLGDAEPGSQNSNGDFSPGFMVDTQQKDMRLVMQACR